VTLVRFNALRHLVFVVDLERPDPMSLNAALRVHQLDVVVVAGAQMHTDHLDVACPVTLEPEDDLVPGCRRREAQTDHARHPCCHASLSLPRARSVRAV
jgi:hypothetical protein